LLKRFPVYPFLFAIYPVLALGAYNIDQIAPGDMLRPLLVSLLFGAALLGVAYLLFRDWHRAALVTAFALLVFFSYGQVYAVSKGIALGGVALFRHRTLGPLWGVLLIGIVYWLGWRLKAPQAATPWLNALSALMLAYPLLTIGSSVVEGRLADKAARQASTGLSDTSQAGPDIYYIILDGYPRQDALKEETGYDNSEFIDALEARGFYVAECAQSNYAHTELSLPSSLNYDYLDHLRADTRPQLVALLKHGAVRAFLESQGYKTVAFPTGFSWTEWTDADIYPRPEYQSALPTEFENLVLGTSLLRIPLDFGKMDFASENNYDRYRQRVLSTLEHLKEIPADPAPTFTFAHLAIPHYPYVFGPNGEEVDNTAEGHKSVIGYRDQVVFVDREILKVVDAILSGSETPPVIVLQGDHGAPVQIGSRKLRMQNLNAYYLPGSEAALYPSISPVNTFRVIFDSYFGQDLPLLPDRSYYSDYVTMFDLTPIPNSCPGK
jgi:hypothetical protein